MTDLNHVVLIGRLTQDLGNDERSFGYIGNGQARANVSIAVNRSKKSGEQWIDEVNYFNVTIWGKTAENLKPYLTKGKQICVEGHLKQDRWEKEGKKESRITIVADNVQLLGGKSENSGNTGNTVPKFVPADNSESSIPVDNNSEGFEEDIPF